MKKSKHLGRKLLILAIVIYAIFTLVNQQKTLNEYDKNSEELSQQIQEQKEYKQELAKKKDEVNSLDFIEQTAREKLDMYYPNEKIFIDMGM